MSGLFPFPLSSEDFGRIQKTSNVFGRFWTSSGIFGSVRVIFEIPAHEQRVRNPVVLYKINRD